MEKVITCPTCGKGKLYPLTIENYNAGVFGIIAKAHFMKCDQCPEQICSAKEIKRWESLAVPSDP